MAEDPFDSKSCQMWQQQHEIAARFDEGKKQEAN